MLKKTSIAPWLFYLHFVSNKLAKIACSKDKTSYNNEDSKYQIKSNLFFIFRIIYATNFQFGAYALSDLFEVILLLDMSINLNEDKNVIIWANMAEKSERCAYLKCCYLAGELKCFGYKLSCALYLKSNDRFHSLDSFNQAMNDLIDKAKAKYEMPNLMEYVEKHLE